MEIIRPICVDFVSYMTIMTEFFSIRKGKNMLLKIFFFGVSLSAFGQSENTTKPWTYWWWMGSAANYSDITWQMERFAEKGLGGVHIIPIYGVKGYEDQFVPFLSKKMDRPAGTYCQRRASSGSWRGYDHRHRLALRWTECQ